MVLASLAGRAAEDAVGRNPVERYSWAVKFICDTGSDLTDAAVSGVYATAIEVQNPTLGTAVIFRSLARSQSNYPIATEPQLLVINPGSAFEIECDQIRQLLPLPTTDQHRAGFVRLASTTPLVVTASYSARHADGSAPSNKIETIRPRSLICEPGSTGDDCSLQCPNGDVCEAIFTRNRDGTVDGIRMFGSVLADGFTSDEALTGYLQLASENETLFALDPVEDPAVFQLTADSSMASASLRIHRYSQRYRGLPVVGPGSSLSLIIAPPHGVISATGTLVDPRPDYAGVDFGVLDEAGAAARALALWQSDGPGGAASVESLELVALPLRRALGYRARIAVAGAPGGSVVFEAALTGSRALVNLVEYEGLQAPRQVTVRARDWTVFNDSFPGALGNFATTRLSAGTGLQEVPLLGSTVDPALCAGGSADCIRLGDARAPFYDRAGNDGSIAPGVLLTNPTGVFLADSVAGQSNFPFKSQTHYHKLRAALGVLDELKECRWDWTPSSGMDACEVPQLAFLVNVAMGPSGLFVPPTFDFNENAWLDGSGIALQNTWLALGHDPQTNPAGDTLAPSTIQIRDGAKESTLYHEIGHYIDWFTSPGAGALDEEGDSQRDIATPCPIPSSFPGCCRPDTSDEAKALTESIGSLFATYFGRRLHELGPRGSMISFSLPTVQSPLPVQTHGEGITEAGVRDFESGRPKIGGATAEEGCDFTAGYNQRWLFQAFWELTDGVVCNTPAGGVPTPPCATFDVVFESTEVSPADVQLQALHHALQKQTKYGGFYKQLVNDMGEFLECTYGADAPGDSVFDHFVEVYSHHGLVPDTPMPRVCPPICGFNGLEEGEICDGNELGGQTCQNQGYDGGNLACTSGCTLDLTGCHLCGNDEQEVVEDCDGEDLAGATCESVGFDAGVLACDSDCTFDTSGCQTCGDGIRQGTEVCDGDDLGGETCETQGFSGGGTLACGPGCGSFDTDGCVGCEPGEPGCACLEEPDLPGGGLLGNDLFCNDDVITGGNVRCVQDGPSFLCQECSVNEGWGCPCGQGEDSCLFAELDPPGLGPNLFCWGHTQDVTSFTGNCWDEPPDWYCDAHCALRDLVCVDPDQILCGAPP